MTLKDAIGKDIFIIDNDKYYDNYLRNMSLAELETLKMRVNNKIAELSIAIKTKQLDHASGGKGASQEWYLKNKSAHSINQRALPYINNLIKRRRMAERSIGDFFMDQARRILAQQDFDTILIHAQAVKTQVCGGNI